MPFISETDREIYEFKRNEAEIRANTRLMEERDARRRLESALERNARIVIAKLAASASATRRKSPQVFEATAVIVDADISLQGNKLYIEEHLLKLVQAEQSEAVSVSFTMPDALPGVVDGTYHVRVIFDPPLT